MVFPSLLIAMLALISLLIALFVRVKGVEQVGFWPKALLLTLSALLLAHVAWYALPFSNAWANLISLHAASQGIEGKIASMTYFQSGNKPEGTQLAVAKHEASGWTLQVLNPDNESLPAFDVPAGSEEFRTIFVQNGDFLLADLNMGGHRAVWKVDCSTGKATRQKATGIEPFGLGKPWSERNGQLLYVTHGEGKYQLKSLTLKTGRSTLLLSSANPILTPSWVNVADPKRTPFWAKYDEKVAYADGAQGLFYVLDLRTKTHEVLKSDLERMEGEKFVPQGKVVAVLPSPDNFRYAYLSLVGPKTVLSVVGANGERRDALYETRADIKDLSWHPDSQQLVFEEKHEGVWQSMTMGFIGGYSNVRILDANQGGLVSLIPPPISHFSPALSPDGVKVAFVAGDGLWYPSNRSGIWIATLR